MDLFLVIMVRFVFLCAPLALLSLTSMGQAVPDSLLARRAVERAVALHTNQIGSQSFLYNGIEYPDYLPVADEHPYLLEDWADGTVQVDGEVFTKVPMLYDLSIDKLIIEHFYSKRKVQLISEKINYFQLDGHRFEYHDQAGMTPGFYEVTYDSLSKVYVRWQKSMQDEHTVAGLERRCDEKKTYFISKDGKYYSVRNAQAAISIFSLPKGEIKKYLHRQQLSLKYDKVKALGAIAQYYDRSKK